MRPRCHLLISNNVVTLQDWIFICYERFNGSYYTLGHYAYRRFLLKYYYCTRRIVLLFLMII